MRSARATGPGLSSRSCRSGSSRETRSASSDPTARASPPSSRSSPDSNHPIAAPGLFAAGFDSATSPRILSFRPVSPSRRRWRLRRPAWRMMPAPLAWHGPSAVDSLSGGWRKRLAIACALASEPDVLLIDEPTNHLDVEGILWLEELLAERARAALFVSHDRYFLERMSSRVLELGRAYPGGLFESDGTYSEFLARRDDFLRGQAAYEESLANTVRRE